MDPHSKATKPTSELMLSVMKSYKFCWIEAIIIFGTIDRSTYRSPRM